MKVQSRKPGSSVAAVVASPSPRQIREARLHPMVAKTPTAERSWARVQSSLRDALPSSTYSLWLEPLACIGVADGALCAEGPKHVVEWTERRYGRLIGEMVREHTGYAGAYLFVAQEDPESAGDGLL